MYVVPDVSEHNEGLTDAYSRDAVIIRAAFGDSYLDQKFLHNTGIVAERWAAGKLDGGCVLYQPYIEPHDAASHFAYLWRLIGPKVPDWLTGIMIDEEGWPGAPYAQHGDKSAQLNRLAGMNAQRMGSWKSVKGYGNLSDLNGLWPHRDPRIDVILAAYTGRITRVLPHQVGQQYTDGQAQWGTPKVGRNTLPRVTAPFGACDHSVFFDVNNAAQFRALWGRPARGKTRPTNKPTVATKPQPTKPQPTKPQQRPKPKHHTPSVVAAKVGAAELVLFADGGVTVRKHGKHFATITKGA